MLDGYGLIAKLTINFCTKSDLQMLLRGKVNRKCSALLGQWLQAMARGKILFLFLFLFHLFSPLNLI